MNFGIYMPIFIFFISLIFAFANVMTERLQKKIKKSILYTVSAFLYLATFSAFMVYVEVYTNLSWIIAGFVTFLISAFVITLAESAFEKLIEKWERR